jgi:hypothetical protein
MDHDYVYAFVAILVVIVGFLVWKIRRENKRKPIWISDPEKELMLHNTSAREKTWGSTSANWKETVERPPRQENEKD